ncbi:AraC family transcriptional regulator [Verticiella sediminum]|uniref:AraC family transcriptional regulator n=1 Tax=Verticiella sediminum TaxID=1247510 RepID=A0A556AXI0_9BURK|nr:AraC family transcriptional regulator [Verticiella sediminum]TSH97663.1 AraC family transcriptional regulator [Verticiella sediminum]
MDAMTRSRGYSLHACRTDADGVKAWMFPICGPHQLRVSQGRMRFQYRGVTLHALSSVVGVVEFGADVVAGIEGTPPSALNYNVSLPLTGEQELCVDGRLVRSSADHGIVVSPFTMQELAIAGDCRKMMVSLSQQSVHRVLEELIRREPEVPLVFESRVEAVQGATAAWWRLVRNLVDDEGAVQPLFVQPSLAQEMEKLLIKGLILAQPNNYSDELARLGEARVPHYVQRARNFMERHHGEDIDLDDVAAAAGVSRDTLFSAFRKHCGISPMAYLKQHRLEEVRRLILATGSAGNVSAIALECGLRHLGRFAVEYRRLFAESPSDTLRRARRAAA